MEGNRQTTFRFDGWTVNRDSGDLARGEHATRLQIQPLQIFVELLENPGEVVTRERLIAKLWPKGIVEFDASLNTAVRKLRIALNDDPEKPRYIETIPRRGYRFIGKLENDAPPATPPPAAPAATPTRMTAPSPPLDTTSVPAPPPPATSVRGVRWPWIAAAACVLAGVAVAVIFWLVRGPAVAPVLAIMPFTDISAEKKDAALSLGIAEELSNRLAQLPSARVVSSTSTASFAGKSVDVREIGEALGATHIIEGSLRGDERKLRVSVRVIDAKSRFPLYSESFEYERTNMGDVEQELAQSVAQQLRLLLSPEQLRRWQARMTRNPEAYDYFIRARNYARERTSDGIDQAGELYRLAIERDPEFALAYIGLADTYLSSLAIREIRVADVSAKVRELLAKAEDLNADAPELHAAKGRLAKEENRYDEAQAHLRRALELNPSDSSSYSRLGNVFEEMGKPKEALEQYTRAAELDPQLYLYPMYRCMLLQDMAKFDEAERACARARDLDPERYWPRLVTSWLERSRGNLLEALRWSGEAMRLAPNQGTLAFYRIDLMLSLRLVSEARAVAKQIVTPDEARVRLLQASLELAEHGPAGLRAYLQESGTSALTISRIPDEAVRLYQIAGDLPKAREAYDAMRAVPGFTEAELFETRHVRAGHAPALVCASLLLAQGERAEGLRLLDRLDEMLAQLERNGYAHYGLDSLRAESLALRGQPDEAMRSLRRAVTRGWRHAWRAQTEPFLAPLRDRDDFKALIKEVEARNDEMRARFHELNTPS
jgi:TolB-like protein/DNA-binding winged helix-turn-helix (wHTH) protein